MQAAVEALGPLTPDAAGRQALRDWVARHAEIYERYEPVFRTFEAASETDEVVALGSARWGERHVARFRSGVAATPLPPRRLDPLISLLMESQHRTLDVASILRRRRRTRIRAIGVEDAITDVMHRSFFGRQPRVNVHPPAGRRPPEHRLRRGHVGGPAAPRRPRPEATAGKRRTLDALMRTGRGVFLDHGYHGTRVDDLVAAAGVSHGAFYRYFKNKDELARTSSCRRCGASPTVFGDIPGADALEGPGGRAALRRWLRRYNETHVNEAAMLRVSLDAALHDEKLEPTRRPPSTGGAAAWCAFLRAARVRRHRHRSIGHGHDARHVRRPAPRRARDRRRRAHHRAGSPRSLTGDRSSSSRDVDHDLADRLAVGDVLQRGRGVVEGERRADVGHDAVRGEQPEQLALVALELVRLVRRGT